MNTIPSDSQSDILPDFSWDLIQVSLFDWIKIIVFSFLLPLWVVLIINEGAVLWKLISWWQADIEFWTIRKYWISTLVIAAIPLVHIYWFYLRAFRRLLLLIHEKFLQKMNQEMGKVIANSILKTANSQNPQNQEDKLNHILIYINRQLSKLPGLIQWGARKLVDQIPFIDLINSFNVKDLDQGKTEQIATDITTKINEIELALIDQLIPSWTLFIIPVNLALLFGYWSM